MPPALDDEAIRQRAYQIWEREGRPHGKEREHWATAKLELAHDAQHADPQLASKKAPPKRTRASTTLKEDPEAENLGKPSKKQRGTAAIVQPPRK